MNQTFTPSRDAFRERPDPLMSLMASAKRLTSAPANKKKRTPGGSTGTSWQDEAWELYDMVGEMSFLVNQIAARVGQAHLYVGKRDAAVEQDPERVEDERITDLLQAFGKSQAGQSQLLNRLALNLAVAGEGWLAGIPPMDPETGERDLPETATTAEFDWHMLSISEVTRDASTDAVKLALDEGKPEEFDPDDIYLIRVWRPHPRRSWEADSATRAALSVLKEIVGLTMHISAQTDSRLAGAGLLIVPQSAQRALNAAAGLPEDAEEDQFTDALIEAMIEPISDRSLPSAVVPLTVTVPDEAVSNFKHMDFSAELDREARPLREDAIRRLAMSQDIPPELLLGTSGMNHWGSWLVSEETIRNHVEPPLALICDALTTQYLWPAMIDDGFSEEDAEQYVVWYSVDHLKSRPNLSSDAKDLHAAGVLSDSALRRSTGFDDSDAPTKVSDDPAIDMTMRMVEAQPWLLSTPGAKALLEGIRGILTGKPQDPIDVPMPTAAPEEDPVEGEDTDDPEDRPSQGDIGGGSVVPEQGGEAEL